MPGVRLYRAVSEAEGKDILVTRAMRAIPSSIQGKWFAENASDAVEWGAAFERMSGVPHRRIIAVTFSEELAARLFGLQMLDSIGPARFATIEQLVEVEEVTLWPKEQ